MATDFLVGANSLPEIKFIRTGRDIAWYDATTGTYRIWEQSDGFDGFVLARSPGLSRRHAFERELIRYLHFAAQEPPEPPLNKINTLSGIVFFNGSGEWHIEEHTSDFQSLTQIPLAFTPDNPPPYPESIDRFLSQVLSPEVRTLFDEMIGLFCVPHTRLEKAFILRGSGANGKSTAMGLIEALLGEDNVSAIPISELMGQFGSVNLQGKLLNMMTEVDFKKLDNSSLFKQIVSGEKIYAQYKGRDGFAFKPYARMLLALDEVTGIADVMPGFQRRIEVIDFPNVFAEGRRNIYLLEELTTPGELEGYFFHRVIPALSRVLANDRLTPVLENNGEVRRFRTPIGEFIDEYFVAHPSARVPRSKLTGLLKEWQGDDPQLTNNALYKWLRGRGYKEIRSGGQWYFTGIRER